MLFKKIYFLIFLANFQTLYPTKNNLLETIEIELQETVIEERFIKDLYQLFSKNIRTKTAIYRQFKFHEENYLFDQDFQKFLQSQMRQHCLQKIQKKINIEESIIENEFKKMIKKYPESLIPKSELKAFTKNTNKNKNLIKNLKELKKSKCLPFLVKRAVNDFIAKKVKKDEKITLTPVNIDLLKYYTITSFTAGNEKPIYKK